jgi:signal transduction histidine kinase
MNSHQALQFKPMIGVKMKLLSIDTIGIKSNYPSSLKRSIAVTNTVAFIFSSASVIIYTFIHYSVSYFQPVQWIFIPLTISFALPLLLNYFGLTMFSRVLLSCIPPIGVLLFSIVAKLKIEDITFNDYYNFRIGLIALCTIPFMLFSISEKIQLAITASICFSCLALSDLIHHLFNVGFYDIGFTDSHYDFINFSSVISALAIMGGILSLKWIIEKQENENQRLMTALQNSNSEIAAQRDELVVQGEKLNQNQLELEKAYLTIEDQKKWLEEELVVYDHEITQFSYNVCHHLRGPVASLSGLVNIADIDDAISKEILLGHIKKSVNHLEDVIADLNHILEIRKDIFRSKSNFTLTSIVNEVKVLLSAEIEQASPIIVFEGYSAPVIFASHSAMVSIFYNLLTNTIKFRDETRQLIIKISATSSAGNIAINVHDNGMGIDLEKHGSDIFKMYKRFHLHKEGKGLGLYLAKLQVVAMGGKISVNSTTNEFTEFRIELPLEN